MSDSACCDACSGQGFDESGERCKACKGAGRIKLVNGK